MTATVLAKSNGTQAAIQVNGVDALVLDNQGIVSGIKPASITPAMLNGAQSGSAPVFGARAWANADGTLSGTNAPRAGGNVASVTFVATGMYDVLFVVQMPDVYYTVVGLAGGLSSSEDTNAIRVYNRTLSGFRMNVLNGNAASLQNTAVLAFAVFR